MVTSTLQQLIKTAMQFHQADDLHKAKELYLQVLSTVPEYPDALHLYGLACHQQGDHENAVSYIRKAVAQVPEQAVLRNNLGDALHRAGALEEAIEQLKIALELKPDYAGAHQNLGSVYASMSEHVAALKYARKAVELNANHPEAWFNLGLALLDHVLLADSVDALRRALTLRPTYTLAATSLIYTLNLLPDVDPVSVADETCRVAAAAFAPVRPDVLVVENRSPLRIGYVSGDFCAHAVNYFFEPVLDHHDKSRFDIFLYSDVLHPDHVTERLQHTAQHWRDMTACCDDEFYDQVQQDRIDILIDLAGYTRHNRLAVFARRAAAVQMSWLGFPNTSGLASMDYRIVDAHTAPVAEATAGTEMLLRLPRGFACFRPPSHAPSVQALPALGDNIVTLGSLHKLEKLNSQVIELWARLLRENPNTRLLLARDQLDSWQQQRLQTLFKNHGIAAHRLKMIELSDPEQSFFSVFENIDILLDTFPWSGHTLACCALWMGVPVVSLYGHSHAGRMVASVLSLMGLDELVAEDTEAYCRIITGLCADRDQLNCYRRELRDRFVHSPLRDESGFTRQLEAHYLLTVKA